MSSAGRDGYVFAYSDREIERDDYLIFCSAIITFCSLVLCDDVGTHITVHDGADADDDDDDVDTFLGTDME